MSSIQTQIDKPIEISEESRFKLLDLAFALTKGNEPRTLTLILNVYSALYWRIRGPVPPPRVYDETEQDLLDPSHL